MIFYNLHKFMGILCRAAPCQKKEYKSFKCPKSNFLHDLLEQLIFFVFCAHFLDFNQAGSCFDDVIFQTPICKMTAQSISLLDFNYKRGKNRKITLTKKYSEVRAASKATGSGSLVSIAILLTNNFSYLAQLVIVRHLLFDS